ncbi:MAG: SDR family NAD(P)-dependent oxidoreductase [Actinobacteria bacterium]|nr:SDR family NAD(P)-dependent oxidoreductase [Actinomycetota bacterium]
MSRPLSEQVVVVVGASSAIGRETAVQFGERGSSVVLAARNEEALQAVADEVERLGGKDLVVPTTPPTSSRCAPFATVRLALQAHRHLGQGPRPQSLRHGGADQPGRHLRSPRGDEAARPEGVFE